MKKLFVLFLTILLTSNAWATDGWQKSEPAGTRTVSDIDAYVAQNNAAIDLMLQNYRTARLSYTSAASLTVSAGGVMVSNSDGSIRLMLYNTAATTVTWANLDTGAEAASTTYYVYAVASAVTDTTFTIKISTNAAAPSGVTYYKKIGSFYNSSDSNIYIGTVTDDLYYMAIVAVSGTIAHGGTIPLPEGFVASQCSWFVGINSLQTGEDSADGVETCTSTCSVDTSRVVTCQSFSPRWGTHTGTANYLIIGIKY